MYIVWRRKWQPTPVFLPGESHGQRNLAGCSPWGRKSQTRLNDFEYLPMLGINTHMTLVLYDLKFIGKTKKIQQNILIWVSSCVCLFFLIAFHFLFLVLTFFHPLGSSWYLVCSLIIFTLWTLLGSNCKFLHVSYTSPSQILLFPKQ